MCKLIILGFSAIKRCSDSPQVAKSAGLLMEKNWQSRSESATERIPGGIGSLRGIRSLSGVRSPRGSGKFQEDRCHRGGAFPQEHVPRGKNSRWKEKINSGGKSENGKGGIPSQRMPGRPVRLIGAAETPHSPEGSTPGSCSCPSLQFCKLLKELMSKKVLYREIFDFF